MRTPYGLELSENCLNCKLRRNGFFCQMSPAELKDFDAIKSIAVYPAGAVLFLEQQPARGIFQVCAGEVKLSISSNEGKTLILKIAGPGDVLGMASVVGDVPYGETAETLRPCQLAFISTHDFRRYLHQHTPMVQRATSYLALQYRATCEQLSAIGLGASVLDRLVKFLLDRSSTEGIRRNESRFALPLSHEQIGEYIGTSRESVTRTLSMLKKKGLLEIHRSTLVIPNRAALAAFRFSRATRSGTGPQLVRLTPAVRSQSSPRVQRLRREQYTNRRRGA
jgi:CRP/FNR family cyclic AMP-dependent transcriptional regulator